jgi:hypothetical protein
MESKIAIHSYSILSFIRSQFPVIEANGDCDGVYPHVIVHNITNLLTNENMLIILLNENILNKGMGLWPNPRRTDGSSILRP